MMWLNIIDRVVIPAVVIALLVGGIAGFALGCALLFRAETALKFMAGANRWVSTRETFAPLEAERHVGPAPRAGGKRPLLALCLLVGGAFAVYFILRRLDFSRGPYVPGVDLRRWFFTGLAMEGMKWTLIAGSAFACVVGALMLLAPQRLAAFESRVNRAHSPGVLVDADEKMHLALEPHVAAHPRVAGWLIAGASLLVTLAMIGMLILRTR